MTGWEVYWFTRLDQIQVVFIVITIVLAICLPTAGIIGSIEGNWESIKKWILGGCWVLAVSIVCGIFIPNTKQAAVIYLLPKIANNEQVQKVPENFVKLLNTKMEEWMKDTMKEKK
jgi:hypothetical protein